MKRQYRGAFHKDGQTTYSDWTSDKETTERLVASMLVSHPEVVSWLENRVEPDQIATT